MQTKGFNIDSNNLQTTFTVLIYVNLNILYGQVSL
jgi:hypothetical protein